MKFFPEDGLDEEYKCRAEVTNNHLAQDQACLDQDLFPVHQLSSPLLQTKLITSRPITSGCGNY